MARAFTAATPHYLSVAAVPVSSLPISMACWFNSTTTAANQTLMGLAVSGTQTDWSLRARGNVAGDPVTARSQVASSSVNADTSAGYTANVWHHACAVFASTTSRAAYLNGGSKGTETSSSSPSGVNRTAIGIDAFDLASAATDGRIAEAAMWNVALTDADVLSLAAGASPLLVRPEGLVAYWPLIGRTSPEIGLKSSANNLTVTGAVAGDHVRIYYPDSIF